MTALTTASQLLAELDMRHVQYQVHVVRPEALMISVVVPGEYWEVEFFDDGHVELERFTSRGVEEVSDISSMLLPYFEE